MYKKQDPFDIEDDFGYRTSSTAFSHRKKTSNNNHIKIRTVSYTSTRSTAHTGEDELPTSKLRMVDTGLRANTSHG